MPRFQVTVQAQLEANNSGPHFSISLDAASYSQALARAAEIMPSLLGKAALAEAPITETAEVPAETA